jgi:hypothetical protein
MTIQWSDADGGRATVFTAQKPMVTRLGKLQGAKRVDVQRTKDGLWLGGDVGGAGCLRSSP